MFSKGTYKKSNLEYGWVLSLANGYNLKESIIFDLYLIDELLLVVAKRKPLPT